MKKYFIYSLFILISCFCIKPVFALNINAPVIEGVSYVNESTVKINYNSSNSDSSYGVQIYNMTLGKFESDSITSTSHEITGLDVGKTYNFIMRAYCGTTVSDWSNIVSATPKMGVPVINSIDIGDKSLTLNYTTNGLPKEVEIYNSNTGTLINSSNFSKYTVSNLTNGTEYKFIIRNCYENRVCSSWSNVGSAAPKATSTSKQETKENNTNASKETYKSPTKISGKYKHAGCGVKDGAGLRNYSSSKNWTVVIRAKNPVKAELIAQKAYAGAKNSHILYSKKKATTYYEKLKNVNWEPNKVNKKCYCSCGTFVTASVNAAFGKRLIHPNTRSNDLASRLKKTGEFSVYSGSTGKKMAKSISKLKRGDIIMSKNNSGYHARIII